MFTLRISGVNEICLCTYVCICMQIYVGTHVHVHTNEALVLPLVCISRMQSVFH